MRKLPGQSILNFARSFQNTNGNNCNLKNNLFYQEKIQGFQFPDFDLDSHLDFGLHGHLDLKLDFCDVTVLIWNLIFPS